VTVTSRDVDIARAVVDKGQQLAECTFGQPGAPATGVASIR
jgi:hypothetical protein